MYAVGLLTGRLDWFFNTFLRRREMLEERDGKLVSVRWNNDDRSTMDHLGAGEMEEWCVFLFSCSGLSH